MNIGNVFRCDFALAEKLKYFIDLVVRFTKLCPQPTEAMNADG
jgi:hypothetical protein